MVGAEEMGVEQKAYSRDIQRQLQRK